MRRASREPTFERPDTAPPPLIDITQRPPPLIELEETSRFGWLEDCIVFVVLAVYDFVFPFVKRGYMFDHNTFAVRMWDALLFVGALYSIVYVPMQLAFPELRTLYEGWAITDALLDAVFTLDVAMKFRTTYRDHGYTIKDGRRVAIRYLRSWFMVDLISSLPFDWMLEAANLPGEVQWAHLVKLFALLRVGRIVRTAEGGQGSGANSFRLLYFISGFVVIGHWLGLLWSHIAIAPLQERSRFTSPKFNATFALSLDGEPWLWNLQDEADGGMVVYWLFTRYACSLYWALTVMTLP